jgi:hypothetical protein
VSLSMRVVLQNGADTDHLFAGREEEFGNGQSIPRHVAHLDEVARALGLPPLGAFAVDVGTVDDSAGLPWFPPEAGLACVRGLLRHLEGAGHGDRRRLADETLEGRLFGSRLTPDQHEVLQRYATAAAAADLRAFEVVLEFAAARPTRFCILFSA